MTTAVQRRRGTNTEHATFTGLDGEITVNTTTYTLHVHDGATVGGIVLAKADGSNLVTSSIDINGGTIDGTVIGGSSAAAGSFTTISASGEIAANGGIALGDNDKAVFGAGSDLQIFHDGSHSYITDAGTGDLRINGASNVDIRDTTGVKMFRGVSGGEAILYHNNDQKLATTSTGIDVTGTVTADGLTVDLADNAGALLKSPNDSSTAFLNFGDSTSSNSGSISYDHFSDAMRFKTVNTERLRLASNGDLLLYEDTGTTAKFFWDASAERLGLGTTSPSFPLHINAASGNIVGVFEKTTGNTNRLYLGAESTVSYIDATAGVGATNLAFKVASTERARLDSSGNLLVGQTSPDSNSVGIGLLASGTAYAVRSGSAAFIAHRKSSDGNIVEFYKDNVAVGSIGSEGGNSLYINSGDTGLRFSDPSDAILPATTAGAARDNAIDLGTSGARFDDIYATNGTIQTSDRNEKQDIEALSDAEQRVAVACKGLLRKFRWKDSVAEKGDEARIHFGIIAQDLQAAFEAEGLDAGDYAMFISTTWTDEETGEERTRMGVRYSELLAFIIAAI